MAPDFDVSKFVGAASAPVALIIATSIFLSNLTTRWWAMSGMFRQLTGEYRAINRDEDPARIESVRNQLGYYERRLKLLARATFLLTLAIVAFILTVIFTGINIMYPGLRALIFTTIGFSFGGMVLLGVAVLTELMENEMGKHVIELEMGDCPSLGEARAPVHHVHG